MSLNNEHPHCHRGRSSVFVTWGESSGSAVQNSDDTILAVDVEATAVSWKEALMRRLETPDDERHS